jgi:hypothetical protein
MHGQRNTKSSIIIIIIIINSNNNNNSNKAVNVRIKVTTRRVYVTIVGKEISVTDSACVSVALIIQHQLRMRCTLLSPMACLARPYFSTLFHKLHESREAVTEHKMSDLIFSTNFVRNISHSKKNRMRYGQNCTQVFM